MAKLNEIGKHILKIKRQKFKDGQDFSIAFLGDSHIGRTNCKCGTDCTEERYVTLLSKINNGKNVYAIIHGGDASDYGNGSLERFVNDTTKTLNYDNTEIKEEDKIPLFSNTGNHDYKFGKFPDGCITIDDYHNNIGKDNDIIEFFGNNKGPEVAVILLNTGYGNSGKLIGTAKFKDKLNNLSLNMKNIIKNHKFVRFIIDMHIPPVIPYEITGTHTLNPEFDSDFKKFLKKYPERILAIAAHHMHGQIQNAAYHYKITNKFQEYSIPVYVTAQGGQCDSNKPPYKNAQYSFYKMNLSKVSSSYMLNSVYRYDMTWNYDKKGFALSSGILIK